MTGLTCECPEFRTGLTCGRAAAWLVQVGARKSDAQLSCARHLSPTCEMRLGAEGRPGAALTVTALTEDTARLVEMARIAFAGSQEVPG